MYTWDFESTPNLNLIKELPLYLFQLHISSVSPQRHKCFQIKEQNKSACV